MSLNPFSKFGRQARPLDKGTGKTFFALPASSTLLEDYERLYPTDEDGVKRVYSGNTAIADAIASCVTGRDDKIYVVGGAYTISTAIAISISDVSIIGLGTPGSAKLTGSAAHVFNLTGDDIKISGLEINIATTKKGIVMTGADNCDIHDNVFKASVGGAASHFIHMVTTACHDNRIHDNQFLARLDVSSAAVTLTSMITGLGTGNIIEHNFFMIGRQTTDNAGLCTNGVVFAAAADAGNLFRHNTMVEFNGAFFVTAGINYGTTAVEGSVMCVENNFMLGTAGNAVVQGSNAASFANNIASGTV